MRRRIAALAWLVALVATPLAALTPHDAARIDVAPSATRLPLTAPFVDEYGRRVTLGDYVGARPAILLLGYYGCSHLCGFALEGVRASLARAQLGAGRDVDVVFVSIAPLEAPPDARRRKAMLFADDASAASGWHFLTGHETAIAALASAAGYAYAYDADAGQYAHPAGALIVTSDGRVRARLPGVAFAPDALRAALAAAAPAEEAPGRWLLCFHDDLVTGRYATAATNAVRAAAVLALVALGVFVIRARWREASGREA